MELKDYVRLLRNHWRGVLVIILVSVAAAAAWTVTRTPVYAGEAKGYVTVDDNNPAMAATYDAVAKSKANSYLELARSRDVAEAVIADLDLTTSPEDLVASVDVTRPADSVTLQVTARAASAEEAQDLASSWVSALADAVEELESPGGNDDAVLALVPVEVATQSTAPISPDPVRNLGLAFLLGCLVGFGYAFLRGTFDHRLRSEREVEELFDVSVVGRLPDVGKESTDSLSSSAALDDLRVNLPFLDVDNPPRVIAVAGAVRGVGASTVSVALARAVESSGQAVVLVDGDLRNPQLAPTLGVAPASGLTDVLTGRAELQDALQHVPGHGSLRLLSSGTVPPNPSDLLRSRAVRTLLTKLAQDAVVVIDGAPLNDGTEGAVAAACADGALVVIASGRTRDVQLDHALEGLAAAEAKVLGLVMNRTSPGRRTRGGAGSDGAGASRTDPTESRGDRKDSGPKRRLSRSTGR